MISFYALITQTLALSCASYEVFAHSVSDADQRSERVSDQEIKLDLLWQADEEVGVAEDRDQSDR